MTAAIANALRPVDALNVRVLVDNVTDSDVVPDFRDG